MPLIDAIKGLACIVIVWHHLSIYGPLPEGAWMLAPAFFHWLADDGRLAVQVFLVIGGFLAAGSLAPQGHLCVDRPLQRVLRRYARLAMPYFVALMASVLIAAMVRPWLHDDAVPPAPGFMQLLAHGFLLQDLLHQEALSAGVWYVAVDFQLYTLALAVFALAAWLRRRWPDGSAPAQWVGVLLVALVTVASLAIFNRYAALDQTAIYFFGAYGLGMLCYWIGQARRPGVWVTAMLAVLLLGVCVLAIEWRSRVAIAWTTALLLAVAQRRGWLDATGWLPLRRVGRISYSLFLVHFPVLLLVNAVFAHWVPNGPWIDLFGLLGSFVLSLLVAALLYQRVESRPASWRAVAALFAGLVACGALASLAD